MLLLCNALGTPIDTKQIQLEPLFAAATSSHVFVGSKDAFFVWHFRNAKAWTHLRIADSAAGSSKQKGSGTSSSSHADRNRERIVHIDDGFGTSGQYGGGRSDDVIPQTNDPICSMVLSTLSTFKTRLYSRTV